MNERQNRKTESRRLHQSWGPTLAGILWIAFCLILVVQGVLRGFNLVTFIASFLIAMWLLNMLVTMFSGNRLRNLRVKRRLMGSVHVGTPVLQSIEIENEGLAHVTGVRFVEQGNKPVEHFGLNHLAGKQRVELRQQVTPSRRGMFTWKPLVVSTGNPFGLFRISMDCPNEDMEALILPMLGQIDQQQFQRWLRHSRRASSLQTRVRAKRTVTPADFYGVRSYRPGDSARWIHWRTTARVGTPMVREFEEPPQDHLTILLDASLPDTEERLQANWLAARKKNLDTIRQQYRHFVPPSKEELAHKVAEVSHNEAPYAEPLHLLEQAISLACTLCYLWTRRLGSTITIIIVDGREDLAVRFDSGPNLRQLVPLMERLALVQAATQHDLKRVQRELDQRALPMGPAMLITPGTNPQAGNLTRSLTRQVQMLDMSKARLLRRLFQSQAKATLKGM